MREGRRGTLWSVEWVIKKKKEEEGEEKIAVMGRKKRERGDRKTRPCDSSTRSLSLSLLCFFFFTVGERELEKGF